MFRSDLKINPVPDLLWALIMDDPLETGGGEERSYGRRERWVGAPSYRSLSRKISRFTTVRGRREKWQRKPA